MFASLIVSLLKFYLFCLSTLSAGWECIVSSRGRARVSMGSNAAASAPIAATIPYTASAATIDTDDSHCATNGVLICATPCTETARPAPTPRTIVGYTCGTRISHDKWKKFLNKYCIQVLVFNRTIFIHTLYRCAV